MDEQKNLNNNNNNNKISKSKKKRLKKKEQYFNLKKIQQEQHKQIIESLEQHNKNYSNIINQLDSAKFLGIKRKQKNNNSKSNIINKEKETNNNKIEEEEEESSEISLISNNNNNNIKNKEIEINKTSIKEDFEKIHKQNLEDLYNEEQKELSNYIFSENILIPSEKDLILISRSQEIINSRQKLPIINQEHEIMYAINNSLVTIICGETGSGKSTQIPQFLYEFGYTNAIGKIAITQPRRVAARALAIRLSEELNLTLGKEIGYQIRYETKNYDKNKTVIKFVTDGILLKEIENDKLLSEYSVIIIDEAHERTINSDLLIGFISNIIKIRFILWKKNKMYVNNKKILPLRLIIMSATLRIDDFKNSPIFNPFINPRVVEVSTRQFNVHCYHSKITSSNYLDEAFKLCKKIHSKLPDGNILIFLTGKKEILQLCEKLKNEFKNVNKISDENKNENKNENNIENNNINEINKNSENIMEEINNEQKITNNNDINIQKNNLENIEEDNLSENSNNEKKETISYKPSIVLPLYSSMSPEDQMKIFQKYPPNHRMIVVSTNVAETSLTIPNVRYVIDSGRVKKRIYKNGLSFSTFQIEWISQASANQRMGRAGRTCEGYCYRLYSNGLYVKMEKFTEPQIITSPLSQVVLILKNMNIVNIKKFPFLSMPNKLFLDKAINHLIIIGALKGLNNENDERIKNIQKYYSLNDENNFEKEENNENTNDINDSTEITDIGRLMCKFPIEPKLSKLIIMSKNYNLIEYIIIIVCIMSVENVFDFNSMNIKNYKEFVDEIKKLNIYNSYSDCIVYLNIIILLLKKTNTIIKINKRKFDEIKNLLKQLKSLCQNIFKIQLKNFEDLQITNNIQNNIICQILLCSFIDNLCRKKIVYDNAGNEINEQILKKKLFYECNENNNECKLGYFSILNEIKPDFLIYYEIISDNNKSSLINNTIIKPEWLYNIGGTLIKVNLNTNFKEPFYSSKEDKIFCFVDIIYGYKNWNINNVAVEMNKNDNNYFRYLIKFILNGDLLPQLSKYKNKLNMKINSIVNKNNDLYIKVNKFIKELKNNNIYNKKTLLNMFKKNNNFLKDVIIMWYDDNKIKNEIKINWPFFE